MSNKKIATEVVREKRIIYKNENKKTRKKKHFLNKSMANEATHKYIFFKIPKNILVFEFSIADEIPDGHRCTAKHSTQPL